ncbi:hypothetical protein [Bosea rubneri]|uniref:Uncharacterized protein n=1 Tax=Bosea rubneri TaxID=3075434 RepID=A0ABU3SC69_9HYPH|nr:hypothetical protein [Bosea sp. ZW T0_25]MDU0342399.1 hypothetical protein [Bosea sp. ZW T0_25]
MRTQEPETLSRFIAMMRHEFRSYYVGEGEADGQIESVEGRFALVASAGELAILFGVLNWPSGEAVAACGKCFQQWLSSRGHTGAGEDEAAINHIRLYIMAHGSSRFAPYEAPDEEVRDRVGWRRVDRAGADYLFQQDQPDAVQRLSDELRPHLRRARPYHLDRDPRQLRGAYGGAQLPMPDAHRDRGGGCEGNRR